MNVDDEILKLMCNELSEESKTKVLTFAFRKRMPLEMCPIEWLYYCASLAFIVGLLIGIYIGVRLW
jgi:hypothetical protein